MATLTVTPFRIHKFFEPTRDDKGGWRSVWEGTPDDDTAPMFAIDLMREIIDYASRGYKVDPFHKLNEYYDLEYCL